MKRIQCMRVFVLSFMIFLSIQITPIITDVALSEAMSTITISNPSITLVLIPTGSFTMGSPSNYPSDEPGRSDDELQHMVTITRPFYMQTTEVTQSQWQAVMGNNPSHFSNCSDCPVETVSWYDAQEFIQRLNQREGTDQYRLPTEAEWEYAARAGSTTAFANGDITGPGAICYYDSNLDAMGWYCQNSSNTTHPVAQKQPNAWGLYDMHGNVWEWCADWVGDYPSGSVVDPTGPSSGSQRTNRGSSYYNLSRYCRSANRNGTTPGNRYTDLGFRLARTGETNLIPRPSSQNVFTCPPSASPTCHQDPNLARPIGLGPVASGGDTLDLKVALNGFSSPVDIYVALYAPSVDPANVYLLASDLSLRPLSAGLSPWRQNTTSAIDQTIFSNIQKSLLPSGTYTFGLVVTPAGRGLGDMYLWISSVDVSSTNIAARIPATRDITLQLQLPAGSPHNINTLRFFSLSGESDPAGGNASTNSTNISIINENYMQFVFAEDVNQNQAFPALITSDEIQSGSASISAENIASALILLVPQIALLDQNTKATLLATARMYPAYNELIGLIEQALSNPPYLIGDYDSFQPIYDKTVQIAFTILVNYGASLASLQSNEDGDSPYVENSPNGLTFVNPFLVFYGVSVEGIPFSNEYIIPGKSGVFSIIPPRSTPPIRFNIPNHNFDSINELPNGRYDVHFYKGKGGYNSTNGGERKGAKANVLKAIAIALKTLYVPFVDDNDLILYLANAQEGEVGSALEGVCTIAPIPYVCNDIDMDDAKTFLLNLYKIFACDTIINRRDGYSGTYMQMIAHLFYRTANVDGRKYTQIFQKAQILVKGLARALNVFGRLNETIPYFWQAFTAPNHVSYNIEHGNSMLIWYKDADGDRYSDGTTQSAAQRPSDIYRSASELTATTGDCEDNNPAKHPGAIDIPNDGIDQDCDGSDAAADFTWYRDADFDRYSDGTTINAVLRPSIIYRVASELTAMDIDCNDRDSTIHPGATEIPGDGIDQDCSGSDGGENRTWYRDADGDRYSDGTTVNAAQRPPDDYFLASELTATTGDCDDNNASKHPGATDIPGDGIDQDCSGSDLPSAGDTITISNPPITLLLIPAGTFTMGSPLDEPGRGGDEVQHSVTITQPFYMQTTEITQSQWQAVMGNNPSRFSNCSDCPVEQVSWNDAQEFIRRLNQSEGTDKYRLPTEAEWEYAARAGSTTAFANGDVIASGNACIPDANLDAMGWHCGNSGSDTTHPVAQKQPNAWWLYDMHGNVNEWCSDWHGDYPAGSAANPVGPANGTYRVIRGGGWYELAIWCRSAQRNGGTPGYFNSGIGFRLARTY